MHPRVVARVLEARSMLPDDAVLVVEAIKLLDSSIRSVFDQIWVVIAPREAMIERLKERGVPAAEAETRLRHQVRAAWDALAKARPARGAGT